MIAKFLRRLQQRLRQAAARHKFDRARQKLSKTTSEVKGLEHASDDEIADWAVAITESRPYPLGVHETLEAWQAGEITYRRAMRLLGVDTIADLYAAARSSGVPIRRGLTPAEERLADRVTDIIGQQMADDPDSWVSALTSDEQPPAAELTAAPLMDAWRWAPTDVAGMYVRGLVRGCDHTTAEVVEIDKSRRWVRDREGTLWRLGEQQAPAWVRSCGCVFCDIGLPPEWIEGQPVHRARGDVIGCTNPAVERQ
jgi:hypothetical protein